MSANKSEDEYPISRNVDEVDSPRKKMRLDIGGRKSWGLIDRRTDHEVLQEMGVSLLEPDDGDSTESHQPHPRPLKRKHNLENVNPNVNCGSPVKYASPKKSPRKFSPVAGPSKARSPRSSDKVKPLTESQLDTTIVSEYHIDEETPLAQLIPSGQVTSKVARFTPLGEEEEIILTKHKWEPQGNDSFKALSDEVMMTVFKWLPKRTLAHCMMVCKRWYRVACDESLWQRLDLGNKTLAKDALGRILNRKPVVVRFASSEIGEWHPQTLPSLSRIQYLDLSMATIDIVSLNNLLQCCPVLKKLSLENIILDNSTCKIIGNCRYIETLNLTMAQGITAEGLTFILKGCQNVQCLNISWCLLNEAALHILVKLLPQHLLKLNIAGARILTDDMVERLVERCPNLIELDMSDCSQVSSGAARALLKLTKLGHLALSRCYLLPAHTLAQLNSMTSLQYLDVFGMLQPSSLNALKATLPAIQINQYMFSAISRPTVGLKRTSVWGLRTRD